MLNKQQLKKLTSKKILTMSLTSLLLFSMTGTALAQENRPNPHYDYVALGDSLAAGQNPYGAENGYSYTNSIKNMLAKSGKAGSYQNFGVSGYTSQDIISQLGEPKVAKSLADAEIITLNIGANDLIGLPEVQTYFAARTNENLAAAAAAVATETPNIAPRIITIISAIKAANPNADIYVMGYYNPFPFQPELKSIIDGLNSVIIYATGATGVTYVDTMTSFTADYLPNALDIHPTHDGYRAIAESFKSAIGL